MIFLPCFGLFVVGWLGFGFGLGFFCLWGVFCVWSVFFVVVGGEGVMCVCGFVLHKDPHPRKKNEVNFNILIKCICVCVPILLQIAEIQELNYSLQNQSRYMVKVRFQVCRHEHCWNFYTADLQSYPRYRTMIKIAKSMWKPLNSFSDVDCFQHYRHTTAKHQQASMLQCSSILNYIVVHERKPE